MYINSDYKKYLQNFPILYQSADVRKIRLNYDILISLGVCIHTVSAHAKILSKLAGIKVRRTIALLRLHSNYVSVYYILLSFVATLCHALK